MVLFAYGFRPFFLVAGLYGVVSTLVWPFLYLTGLELPTALGAVAWHAHEMIHGYATAALAGFLLTVTPNWTGTTPRQGRILMGLVALWLAGRVAVWLSALIPVWIAAALDIAFLPVLLAIVGQPLLREKTGRQRVFLGLVAVLAVANLLGWGEAIGLGAGAARAGFLLGIGMFVVFIAIMGGRMVPSFTGNILRRHGEEARIRNLPWLERIVLPATLAYVLVEVLFEGTAVAGILALAVGLGHLARQSGWRPAAALRLPILWILHLGFAWMAAGLVLRGAAVFVEAIPPSAALHALTIGAVGSMTLAVMSRASLGHTGREIVAAPPVVLAYLLINAAALVRVLVPILAPGFMAAAIWVSALAWAAGFALFSLVYVPILTRPRIDGRPG